MSDLVNLNNISIVLQRPRYPENIGSAARAMRNMGINRLIVVDPLNCDLIKVLKLATHSAADIIKQMELFDNLGAALAPFRYVVGTTARLGGERPSVLKPSKMAESLISISQKNPTAIVFGSEDRGLTNKEIKYCHSLVNIPTAEFSSLNLSQAVMIVCYELFLASRSQKEKFTPRLASSQEIEDMYKHLEDVLIKISFINHEKPDHWMNNIRRFFSRLQLRGRDIKIIRGICRQINWYAQKETRNTCKEIF
ncbi:tRNA (cytidine/uridine-2'-O-)-methyltransferase TrmJ [Candidatus Magnetomoraceae bacterium gMMP-15]